jgi:predicted GNAT family N-acyltransferase
VKTRLIIIRRVTTPFTVRSVDWLEQRDALRAVRHNVFVEEQNVPEDMEWDEDDAAARHVLAFAGDGTPIGTGRLTEACRIGRMAVLAAWRKRGVGQAILRALLQIARDRGCRGVVLHAQIHAIDFYARSGFTPVGPVFEDAGIAHRLMKLAFDSAATRR